MEKGPKDEAVMCKLEGRVFPVEITYLDEATADVVRTAVETIYDIHLKVIILLDSKRDSTDADSLSSNLRGISWSF